MTKDKSYDLTLGDFGPYNKEYLGASHIADKKRGVAFQIAMFPSFFRRRVFSPNSINDSGAKMWGANANLTRFVYRYEMEWKDRVYCDVDYAVSEDKRCDVSCTFVNNTEIQESVAMNCVVSLERPYLKNGKRFSRYKTFVSAKPKKGCVIVDALDFDEISSSEKLAVDGKFIGEREEDFSSGCGTVLSGELLTNDGVLYTFDSYPADSVGVRVKAREDTYIRLVVNGSTELFLEAQKNDGFVFPTAEFKKCAVNSIRIYPNSQIFIDSIVIGKGVSSVEFYEEDNSVEAERDFHDNSMSLYYRGIDKKYTVSYGEPQAMIRRIRTDNIEASLVAHTHNHVNTELSDGGERIYEVLVSEPLFLAPGEKRTLHYTFSADESIAISPPEKIYCMNLNPDGERYKFSQNMMMYNTFMNVVYPIYTRRQYIKHNTPGRNWDCLYTWDSGFIGMGLASGDFDRGFECLNTYLTPVGDKHSPFIFHGSVVPTQIFLYQYLFNKYPEKREKLKSLFPMIKEYFRFFANMDLGEEQMRSGLLKTWHLFYNSGGWDDYPPQKALHANTAAGSLPSIENTTPIITTAITVLIAKILKKIAEYFDEQTEEYEKCIEKFTFSLQNGTFDEESGYFSYVVHDENKEKKEFFRYKDGTNYNLGIDGIYPFISGITTAHQDALILENIRDGLLTDIGVSAVDTRAPYYSKHGYWNGSVWMPHQWVLWRSLLDFGDGALALEIAEKALELWRREVDNTYCCFEHFMNENARGAGFHQFSGLSTPVLLFAEAYFKKGSVTVGFDTVIERQEWSEDKTHLEASFKAFGKRPLAIITLDAKRNYQFVLNGKSVLAKRLFDGTYEIGLERGVSNLFVIPER